MQQPPQIPSNPYAAPQAVVADFAESGQLELAGRGMRFAGALIDNIILSVLLVPAMFASGYFTMLMNGQPPSYLWNAGAMAVSFVALVVIQGYFLNQSGQTIAKKLLGMKIVDLNGNKPEFIKLVSLRYGVLYLIGMIPIVGGLFSFVDALFIFREDRRCIHDLIAGTRVVLV